jgi:hypothetical protein
MRRSRSILILFAFLALGLSLGFPAEDVLDALYDESEALPCESTPAVPETVAQAPTVRPCASRFRLGFLRRPGTQHLDQMTGWAHPISDSLTILDHSFRC